MAQADAERVSDLLATVTSDSEAVGALLEVIADQAGCELTQQGQLADPEPQIDKAAELQQKWDTRIRSALAGGAESHPVRGFPR
jgi:hypothetical protein